MLKPTWRFGLLKRPWYCTSVSTPWRLLPVLDCDSTSLITNALVERDASSSKDILTGQKVRVKVTLVQALRLCTGRLAHRGSRGISLPFLGHGTRRVEGSASRPGRSLPPGKTRYPLYRRLSGPQGRSGLAVNLTPPGFNPRTVQPVVSRYTDWATRPTSLWNIW